VGRLARAARGSARGRLAVLAAARRPQDEAVGAALVDQEVAVPGLPHAADSAGHGCPAPMGSASPGTPAQARGHLPPTPPHPRPWRRRRIPTLTFGLALIRDGNGPRSFETLLRYRGAAMAEFWRALRTLKALQAEQVLQAEQAASGPTLAAPPIRPPARPPLGHRFQPNEPKRSALPPPEYVLSEPPAAHTLHETTAPWLPNEPKARPTRHAASALPDESQRRRLSSTRSNVGESCPSG
jgi:hypothetical protein